MPIFMKFRCILFLDTSESGVFVESRCIWNVWFLDHTSEMPPFRAFPMYCYTSFSRRYIGIEISMPIPMYGGSNLSKIYIGMGQHRLFPMYRQKCQNKIHRKSAINSHPDVSKSSIHRKPRFSTKPDVSHLISREYTCIPS